MLTAVDQIKFTPKNERDYGTLACYGKNSIGKQSEPCLFQVVPAGKRLYLYTCALVLINPEWNEKICAR